MRFKIRQAEPEDLYEVAEIYRHYHKNTEYTCGYEPASLLNFLTKYEKNKAFTPNLPFHVAEETASGTIVAYQIFHPLSRWLFSSMPNVLEGQFYIHPDFANEEEINEQFQKYEDQNKQDCEQAGFTRTFDISLASEQKNNGKDNSPVFLNVAYSKGKWLSLRQAVSNAPIIEANPKL